MKNEKVKLIKVTSTTLYAVPEDFEIPNQEIINEWFTNYPLSRYHASRDSCKVGGSEKLVKVEVVPNE